MTIFVSTTTTTPSSRFGSSSRSNNNKKSQSHGYYSPAARSVMGLVIAVLTVAFFNMMYYMDRSNNAPEYHFMSTSSSSSSLSSLPSSSSLSRNQDLYPWPGVPASEVGHVLVKKGQVDFVDNARQLLLGEQEHGAGKGGGGYLDEFITIYQNRPDKVNLCGMRINHSYALFLAIKVLQPTALIESGINAGHSTYLMRATAPRHAKIYAIDPLEQPICNQGTKRWMDNSTNSHEYFTGPEKFIDFAAINWAAKIKSGELDPDRTLVFLDDHLDPSLRYPTLLKYGFRHVLLEDNYKVGKGATPGDKAGWLPKQLFSKTNHDAQFFWSVTKRYAEFPPLVPPIIARGTAHTAKPAGGFLHDTDDLTTITAPLLRPDQSTKDLELYRDICRRLEIADPTLQDKESYMQVMNYNQFAYLELVPMSPRLMEKWT